MLKSLKEEINCIFERDPAAQSVLEIVTAYPGFHAVLIHRISHRLWGSGFRWFARWLSHLSRWLTGIEIHPGAELGQRFFIDHGMGVVIGETAVIGDDCTLYHGVTLGGTTWQKGKRHPTLGKNVVIGAGAKVLGPIEIGDCARIGSNSVVIKSVPAGATVVGIPAHIISASKENSSSQRAAIANQIGFDAYGATANMPDPVAHAINRMLDHIHLLDKRVESMQQIMTNHGFERSETPLPELEGCEIETGDEDDLS